MIRINNSSSEVPDVAPCEGETPAERRSAQFATCYGATTFAYGGAAQQDSPSGSVQMRKLRTIRRNRGETRRRRLNAGSSVEDGGDAEGLGEEAHRLVRRDSGSGGGRGGQSHSDQHGREQSAAPDIQAGTGSAVTTFTPGVLQAVAAAHANDAERASAVYSAACDRLLALRDEMASRPGNEFDARMYELSIEMLAVKQKGELAPQGMTVLRQLLIDASRCRPGNADKNPVTGTFRSGNPSGFAFGRIQRLNELLGLILLNHERPSTSTQHKRALNTLALQRAASRKREPDKT